MDENFIFLLASRLKEEREKLGLNQEQAGNLCGVSRVSWGKYERAEAVPGADVLFKFSALGADAQYIFSGVRVAAKKENEFAEPPQNYAVLNKKRVEKLMDDLSAEQQAEIIRQMEEKKRLNMCVIELNELKKQVG